MEGRVVLKFLRLSTGFCYHSTVSRPVITIPLKSQKRIRNEHVKSTKDSNLKKFQEGNTKICIISCKNAALNHYSGQSYG